MKGEHASRERDIFRLLLPPCLCTACAGGAGGSQQLAQPTGRQRPGPRPRFISVSYGAPEMVFATPENHEKRQSNSYFSTSAHPLARAPVLIMFWAQLFVPGDPPDLNLRQENKGLREVGFHFSKNAFLHRETKLNPLLQKCKTTLQKHKETNLKSIIL